MTFRGGRIPDERLLEALDLASCGSEFVDADSVRRRLSREEQLASSTQGVGQRLSRMAKRGRCESRWDFYMNRYRSVRSV